MTHHRSDRLIRHSLLLLAASQATNIANMLFHVFMGRLLSPVEYGALVAMLGLLMIFGTPLAALSNSLAFYSAQLIEENRPGAIKPFMLHWLKKFVFIGAGILVVGLALSPAATSFFKLQRMVTFILTIIVMVISLYGPVVGGILQGIQAFWWSAVSSIASGVFRIIVGGLLVYMLARIADWGIVAHGIGVLAGLIIMVAAVIWIFRNVPAEVTSKNVTGYFAGSLIVLTGFSVMMNTDVLIVKHFFSPEESGLFACASIIGKIAIFLPMPIVGALFPKVIAAGSSGVKHKRLLLRGILLAGGIIGLVVIGGSVVPQLPLKILYPKVAPSEAVLNYIRFMLLALSPLSLAYIVMNYHLAQNRFKLLFLLPVCAIFYLACAAVWHTSIFQIIAGLAVSGLATLAILLIGLPWRNRKPAESGKTTVFAPRL